MKYKLKFKENGNQFDEKDLAARSGAMKDVSNMIMVRFRCAFPEPFSAEAISRDLDLTDLPCIDDLVEWLCVEGYLYESKKTGENGEKLFVTTKKGMLEKIGHFFK